MTSRSGGLTLSTRPKSQRGVALITAILVVALATIAATAVMSASRIALHRAAQFQNSEKAWWYANGIENWVLSILARDAEDNSTDSLKDAWAKPVDYLPVDEGSLRGAVQDQQGLFNLNNLATQDATAQKKYVDHFERLLLSIDNADVVNPRAVAAAVRDWVDADSEPGGLDGAEDTEYLIAQPPYRAANRPLESVAELLAIRGVSKKLYGQLLPYVTALPQTHTPLNINTAPDLVLRAMVNKPGPELETFLRDRTEQPAKSTTDVQTAFGAESPPISVSSQYFLLRSEAFIGSSRVALYSFYYRPTNGAPIVLGRSTDTL